MKYLLNYYKKVNFLLIFIFLTSCTVESRITNKEDALILINNGIKALRVDRLDIARSRFQLALEYATIPEALDGLGCIVFRIANSRKKNKRNEYLDLAYDLFKKTIDLDEDYALGYAHIGDVLYKFGDIKAAEIYYKKAILIDPGLWKIRTNLALLNRDNNKLRLAKKYFSEAREIRILVSNGHNNGK